MLGLRLGGTYKCCKLLQVCLELLIAIALRNRDRIVLIWPLVHEYLAAVMSPDAAKTANPLVSRVRPQVKIFPGPAFSAQPAMRALTFQGSITGLLRHSAARRVQLVGACQHC